MDISRLNVNKLFIGFRSAHCSTSQSVQSLGGDMLGIFVLVVRSFKQ